MSITPEVVLVPSTSIATKVITRVSYGVTAVVIASFGFIHLIFWGFGGEVVVWDSVFPVLTGAVWIAGLIGVVVVRRNARTALLWAIVSLGLLGVLILIDIVRFAVLWATVPA